MADGVVAPAQVAQRRQRSALRNLPADASSFMQSATAADGPALEPSVAAPSRASQSRHRALAFWAITSQLALSCMGPGGLETAGMARAELLSGLLSLLAVLAVWSGPRPSLWTLFLLLRTAWFVVSLPLVSSAQMTIAAIDCLWLFEFTEQFHQRRSAGPHSTLNVGSGRNSRLFPVIVSMSIGFAGLARINWDYLSGLPVTSISAASATAASASAVSASAVSASAASDSAASHVHRFNGPWPGLPRNLAADLVHALPLPVSWSSTLFCLLAAASIIVPLFSVAGLHGRRTRDFSVSLLVGWWLLELWGAEPAVRSWAGVNLATVLLLAAPRSSRHAVVAPHLVTWPLDRYSWELSVTLGGFPVGLRLLAPGLMEPHSWLLAGQLAIGSLSLLALFMATRHRLSAAAPLPSPATPGVENAQAHATQPPPTSRNIENAPTAEGGQNQCPTNWVNIPKFRLKSRLAASVYGLLGSAVLAGVIATGLSPYLGLRTVGCFNESSCLRTEGLQPNHLFMPQIYLLPHQLELVEIVSTAPTSGKVAPPALIAGAIVPKFEVLRRKVQDSELYFRYRRCGHTTYPDPAAAPSDAAYLPPWWSRKLLAYQPIVAGTVTSH